MEQQSIYDFVQTEEAKFQSDEIQVADNWYWNFRNHVQLIFHLKNGVFYTGENNWMRAFKAVLEPMIQLSMWTEDIEVKDVVLYIEDAAGKVLSFLSKKYHDEVYTREHDLDALFDQITESDITYGGVLLQKGTKTPEVVKLKGVAFCDQTNILGGPIGYKFFFSPSKLREMEKFGWGNTKNGATISIDDLCTYATTTKDAGIGGRKNNITGKNIEVYVVRGNMPESWLKDSGDTEYYCNQLQIVALYTDKDNKKQGVTLYRKTADESDLKFFTSEEVEDRALGRGDGERMLHPQIWTNFLTIHKTAMLESGSKSPLWTDDESFTQKNKIQDMENLEITTLSEGRRIGLIPTMATGNIQEYDSDINQWFSVAQRSASAYDPIMGKEAASGTTFRGQERSVAQGQGLHKFRMGKRAKWIEEIYRDWIIPDMKKEILKGSKFLATLTTEELGWVSDQVATNETNKKIKEMILNGAMPSKQLQDELTAKYKADFLKKGNKHLLEIVKGEFENVEIKMGINVAGKQKDLVQLSDKLLSIFQFIFQNPAGFQQAMQIPALAKSFENLLEFGNMSIADFSSLLNPVVPPTQQLGQTPSPAGLNPNEIPPSPVQVPQLTLNK